MVNLHNINLLEIGVVMHKIYYYYVQIVRHKKPLSQCLIEIFHIDTFYKYIEVKKTAGLCTVPCGFLVCAPWARSNG